MHIRLLEQELAALHELTGKAESLEETQKIITHHRDMAVQKVQGIIAGLDAFDTLGEHLFQQLLTQWHRTRKHHVSPAIWPHRN
ncbi:hypothetical protein [Arthrobacter psychrolactophilus]